MLAVVALNLVIAFACAATAGVLIHEHMPALGSAYFGLAFAYVCFAWSFLP